MVTRKKSLAFVVVFSLIFTMMMSVFTVFADKKINASEAENAKRDLTNYVYSELSQNQYPVDGGGYLQGSELFDGSATEGYDLQESEFQTLTSAAQTELVGDIAQESKNAVEEKDNVSDSTVQNWWKELQTKKGVGSKFMNEILKNTKPDFVTANAIYQPFSGPVSTVIGIIAVLLMAFLGVVMVSDIAYIALPPVRMLVADEDNGKGGKPGKSKIFSYDAIYAVKCAEENSDGGSGGGKQALGIYFKRRIFMLILLGICLLYLVQGQLYTLVGYILDIVSGFLGF